MDRRSTQNQFTRYRVVFGGIVGKLHGKVTPVRELGYVRLPRHDSFLPVDSDEANATILPDCNHHGCCDPIGRSASYSPFWPAMLVQSLIFHCARFVHDREHVNPQQAPLTQTLLEVAGHFYLVRCDGVLNLRQRGLGFTLHDTPWSVVND
ncbi:MAG TPA: hypothetical protein VKI65_11395 [Gemmataceae bacterium]|nr:hypothetical protein [Gemmataceae bacterium]